MNEVDEKRAMMVCDICGGQDVDENYFKVIVPFSTIICQTCIADIRQETKHVMAYQIGPALCQAVYGLDDDCAGCRYDQKCNS